MGTLGSRLPEQNFRYRYISEKSRAARVAYVTCKEWSLKKYMELNAGGTADLILIISVPGYCCIPGRFLFLRDAGI